MAKKKSADNEQAAWLRKQIAAMEKDAKTVEPGELPGTGLTLEEQSVLAQYRFELELLEDPPTPQEARSTGRGDVA